MNPRLAKFLARLYPSSWRRRYGVEFVALLESGKSDLRTSANVVWSAICERIVPTPAINENAGDQKAGSVKARSWWVRAQWAIFALGPVFLLAGAYLVALFLLWSGWKMFLPGADTPFRAPTHGLQNIYFQAARFLYFGAPVIVGWAVGIVAARQRAKAVWLGVGLVLIALAAATNQVHASRTEVSRGFGHISMTFGAWTSFQTIRDRLIYAAVILSIAALPYLVWRLQRARSLLSL
jgi:hypothetical protein